MKNYFVLTAVMLCVCSIVLGGGWYDWRGPNHDGSTNEKGVVRTFSETENVVWSVDMPGVGASTPIIAKGKIFLTSADKDDKSKIYALCYDQATGKGVMAKGISDARAESASK